MKPLPLPEKSHFQSITYIIVTFNSSLTIGACVSSLLNYTSPFDQIVVYDNSSSDNTVSVIKQSFPVVHVLCGRENVGFSKAVNYAARLSSHSLICLVNPDSAIREFSRSHTLGLFSQFQDLAVLYPTIDHSPGHLFYSRPPAFVRPYLFFSKLFRSEFLNNSLSLFPCEPGIHNVFHGTGAFVFINPLSCSFSPSCLLDPRFPLGYEDLDLCIRTFQSSKFVMMSDKILVAHAGGQSRISLGSKSRSLMLYSFYCFLSKYYTELVAFPLYVILRLFTAVKLILILVIRSRYLLSARFQAIDVCSFILFEVPPAMKPNDLL